MAEVVHGGQPPLRRQRQDLVPVRFGHEDVAADEDRPDSSLAHVPEGRGELLAAAY